MPHLVIGRKVKQRFFIGDEIIVSVSEIMPNGTVRIGITAPANVKVLREELVPFDEVGDYERAAKGGR